MKTLVKLGLAMLAGFGLGAGAFHELHAQDTPPAYIISEIDVLDENGYANEYIPLANKALAGSGQKRLALSGNTVAIAGDPPKSRIALSIFNSMDKAQAAYTSPAYVEAQNIGEKYAKIRIFAFEGTAP
jgi:uncharacterized protein (DUF1330 family)